MTAEVLAVGTELLMGQIANTNAQYISARLPDLGINVFFHSVVGDNPQRLKDTLSHALGRSDIVIMTGGLGPTMDDLTKETVAAVFGKKLTLHEESLARIMERMNRFGHGRIAKSNEKQAYFPEGALILRNDNGTAPGCVIEQDGKTVILLPGPPSEMRPMFDGGVMPFLAKYAEYRLVSKFVRVFGVGESLLEEMLGDLVAAQTNPTLATYAKEGEVTLRLTARCEAQNAGQAEALLAPLLAEVKKRVGDCVFSTENEDLEAAALAALISRGQTLSLAESCTGGLVSARLTELPGASKALLMSAVTYSNAAKMSVLGVRAETLEKYGAVSRQTAEEMALGARRAFGSDLAVSVTGVAGPDGGSAEKPVGLVYLAIADAQGVYAKEIRAVGSRARVRGITCLHAFDMIRRAALGLPRAD
ncbi:MAG: competence/damage-inducible protein A [Clostridiales bacterium]|jgi:nicotinamide-nucleotide amidase|nr:competence/damage-inducible protein A [Clostridiales bacterium]